MSSLITGFEYDIFISYRHNDNRSGWVTEFVNALQEELAATIKEPLSIYFDKNPHDGLLETHNVDKSLEGKLKCLIFIPILSQTYCDPKSFAWKNEFLEFILISKGDAPLSPKETLDHFPSPSEKVAEGRMRSEGPGLSSVSREVSSFGLDIKLMNGNVASRILPVKIHDIDSGDKTLLENELGGVLRSIDFIYREPGVNRPLKSSDNKADNLNKTDYRNQINKVANAIKELIVGIQNPKDVASGKAVKEAEEVPVSTRKKLSLVAAALIILGVVGYALYYFSGVGSKFFQERDRSIAVLPFENMNRDSTQDYFGNGIAEDILNHLVKISDLEVKSRTSTLQYKGTTKTAPVIGDELGVSNIVEGSVRRVGDKVRIVVQLIDAKNDKHLWSETYDRDFKDVLSLQSEIAIEIARALEAKLTLAEKESIKKEASSDVTAYDYFLKAREMINRFGSGINGNATDLNNAMMLVNQAIQLDRKFTLAFALKGQIWFKTRTIGTSEKTWTDSAIYYSSKAIELDSSIAEGYLVKAAVMNTIGKIDESAAIIRKAYETSPNNPDIQFDYGYELMNEGISKGADLIVKSIERKYQSNDPQYYVQIGHIMLAMDNIDEAEKLFLKARSMDPASSDIIYLLYSLYESTAQYDKALDILKYGNQQSGGIIDAQAEIYTLKKDYALAAKLYERYKEIESNFEDSTQTIPLRHRLGFAYAKLGKKKEADDLIQEQLQILNNALSGERGMGAFYSGLGGVYYDRALCLVYQGRKKEALNSLDSAFHYGWRVNFYYHNDPFLVDFQKDDDYRAFLKKADAFRDFRKEAFTNALNRARASKEWEGLLDK